MRTLGNAVEVRYLRLTGYCAGCFCLETDLMPFNTSLMFAISDSMEESLASVVSVGFDVVSINVNVLIEGKPPASMLLMNMVSESASNKATVEPGDKG